MLRTLNIKNGIFFLACIGVQTQAFAAGYIEDGERFYAQGQLDKAGRCFQAKLAGDPENATAHYLLGNVFLAMKRVPDAVKEYQKSFELDEDGKAGQYSKQALAKLVPAAAAHTESKASEPVKESGDAALARTSAANISRQTEEREKKVNAECDAKVKTIMDEGDRQVKQLEQEMNARISENGRALYFRGRKYFDPEVDNRPIREEYRPKIESIKEQSRKRADEVIATYRQQSAALEDSAIMLDKSYLNPGRSIKLSPGHTDIYVRSYETSDEASGSPVPVHAAPARALQSPAPAKAPSP